jgi:hypothetical protein
LFTQWDQPENQKLLLRFLYVSGFIGILLLISAALVWIFESKGDGANTIASFWTASGGQ